MKRHRYDRQGLLALDPRAFLGFFVESEDRSNADVGGCAVVSIRGPLDHHAGWWADSYEEILARVDAACASSARAVVLRIDSPGGTVAGMLDTARALRARCDDAGKRLLAYVDGQACSAAYALACAADAIVAEQGALVGSVGVISTRLDLTQQAEALGVRVALVTSGARKADGHPHAPLGEAELAAQQTIVDSLAGAFFAHVGERRGLEASAVAALEAGVFTAPDAVTRGLVDAVGSLDDVLAMVAGGEQLAGASAEVPTMTDEEKARAALQAVLDDEDADEKAKARARKALAAMDEDDSEEKESKAEDEKPSEEASASSKATVQATTAGELAATVAEQGRMLAQLQAEREEERRSALLASRPDLPVELRKVLGSKPLAEVKAIVEAMPRAKAAPAASAVVGGTRGEAQGDGTTGRLPANEKAALDARMGLAASKPGVLEQGNKLVLGAMLPATVKGA